MSDTSHSNHSHELVRVLFVDDEPSVLDGLRRSLRSMRTVWQMSFANSAEEALQIMDERPVDVIVSDMRMPSVDGLELLTRVRDLYPDTVRIVLSGQTGLQSALRSVSIAQAFLHKPSAPDIIKDTIERTTTLSNELNNDAVRRIVGRIDALPSPPTLIKRLNECLLNEDVDITNVAETASSDPAVTAKILQLANSSYFGVTRPVVDIEDAITLLGLSTVRDLAASSKLFEVLSSSLDAGYLLEFELHANKVAQVARVLRPIPSVARDSFSAAIMHDIGELVIAMGFPDEHAEIVRRVKLGENRCDIEDEIFGLTHASVGAHLLRLWGLPPSVIEAVAWHHRGPQLKPWEMNAVHSSYLAELIVEHDGEVENLLPENYLDALGFTGVIATENGFTVQIGDDTEVNDNNEP